MDFYTENSESKQQSIAITAIILINIITSEKYRIMQIICSGKLHSFCGLATRS